MDTFAKVRQVLNALRVRVVALGLTCTSVWWSDEIINASFGGGGGGMGRRKIRARHFKKGKKERKEVEGINKVRKANNIDRI